MQENNTYKYLSIVLAIIAITFAVLYFTKPGSLSEIRDDISIDSGECRAKVQAWQTANGGKPITTPDAMAELETILSDCEEIFKNVGESDIN